MSIEEKELQIVQATHNWAKSLQDFQSQKAALEKNLKDDLQTNEDSFRKNLSNVDQNLYSQLRKETQASEEESSRLYSSKRERLRKLDDAISSKQNQIDTNKRRLSKLQTDMDTYIGKVEAALRANIDSERRKIAERDARLINEVVSNYSFYRGKAADHASGAVIDEDMIYTWKKSCGNGLRIASNVAMVAWMLVVAIAIIINIISGIDNPIGKVMFNPFILILLGVAIIVWIGYRIQYKRASSKLQKDHQSTQDMFETKKQEMRRSVQQWFKEHPYYLPQGASADSYIPMGASNFSYMVVPYNKVNLNDQLNKAIQSCYSYKPTEIGNDFKFELNPSFKSLFY